VGKLALAAKVTHVPSLYLSELPGPHHGCRQAAIEGHFELGRRCRALGVDTIVVFDVHWLVNAGYHVNCAPKFKGVYTSNELPHFIKNMPFEYDGNPRLGRLIAETATEMGVPTRAHDATTLDLEYGTLVPMRYMHMDPGNHFTVVSIAAWCNWHKLEDSARFGLAVRRAIEVRYDGTVAILASGSLSHRFNDNGSPEDSIHEISDEFYRQIDLRVVELWQKGDWKTFVKMLPTYNATCHGEGHMHDTAMLLGALGWDRYDRTVEVITPYFASSGTGQINAVFPVTPLSA
jgi:3,4-dihydroxyphenylacetate 2,3-dioxygenase